MLPARLSALGCLLALIAGAAVSGLRPFVTPASPLIRGRVLDGGRPVEGAHVRFQGQSIQTLTDTEGRFRLSSHPGPAAERITAWKTGYRIAGDLLGSGPLNISLTPLPSADWEDYAWVEPAPDPAHSQNCGNCHDAIYREWEASSHAGATRNRRFLNLYDGSDWHGRPNVGWNLLADNPDGAGVCNACHAPTLPFDADLRHAQPGPLDIHCDYCHKVIDAATDKIGLRHGRFGLQLLRPKEGQLFFGPLDDVDRGEDSFSPIYQESRYCASCHEGTVFGVAVYGTYSEWLASPSRQDGKQCQTCHMAPTGTLTNLAPGHGGIERDSRTLASHHFPGGQRDMLHRCLQLRAAIDFVGSDVRANIEVLTDGVGHRVPTGFPDRNLVLAIEASDGASQPVPPKAGPTLTALAGSGFAGLPGKLYAKQLKDFQGNSPAPFWRADPELADSRLFPGQADRATFAFPKAARRIRVRLLYRRFWPKVAAEKGWPGNEVTVVDHVLDVGDEPFRWTNAQEPAE
jgi:hypothetical protein